MAISPPRDVPPPSFTFGGANAPAESGGSKKILLGVAAVVLIVAGTYLGWQYFAHRAPASPAPVSQPTAHPAQVSSAPATPAPSVKPAAGPAAQPPSSAAKNAQPASDEDDEPATPISPVSSKASPAGKPAAAPLVVKGGTVRGVASKPAVPDTPAPSVIGIAAPSASGPLPNLTDNNAAHPVLQRMNISQGVSQGLLIKKVDPVYPPAALSMHIEGTVQLLATISKNGDITDVKVLAGDSQFTTAAMNAVKRWKYKPYLLSGEPVEIQTQITINFKLPH